MGLPAVTSSEELSTRALYQLDLLLQQQTTPDDTAAILIEPVLGEGGYVPAPPSFLKGLREVADKHGLLLIFDEVQCGFGRTGKYFFCEYSGVVPDIMVVAKGIANGFPLSGIISRKDIMDAQAPGTIVRTGLISLRFLNSIYCLGRNLCGKCCSLRCCSGMRRCHEGRKHIR